MHDFVRNRRVSVGERLALGQLQVPNERVGGDQPVDHERGDAPAGIVVAKGDEHASASRGYPWQENTSEWGGVRIF